MKFRVSFIFSQAIESADGVSQSSVLEPLHLAIYMNDLPHRISSDLQLFVGDGKLNRDVCDQEGKPALQENPVRLQWWADNKVLAFNSSNGKLVHP